MEKQLKNKKTDNIKILGCLIIKMVKVQFALFKINVERTRFPPFGRIDMACYPASLLRKAY